MNHVFGLTIEGLVAVLLLLTILFCARLNSRLKLLKADERAMKTTIAELVLATENAERAIAGLNATVREAEDTLATQLRDAEIFNLAISENLASGEDVLNRLRKIAHAGKIPLGPHHVTRLVVTLLVPFLADARSIVGRLPDEVVRATLGIDRGHALLGEAKMVRAVEKSLLRLRLRVHDPPLLGGRVPDVIVEI